MKLDNAFSKREGLIRARQVGAKAATGEILVFLDAHSEANYNWLPPLVEPIALDYRTVVCPFVDVIDCDTYELRPQDEGARGSFDWEFNYKVRVLARLSSNTRTSATAFDGRRSQASDATLQKPRNGRRVFCHQHQVVLGAGWL